MRKIIPLVIISICVGLLFTKIMYSQYDVDNNVKLTSNNSDTYYFISLGSYSSYNDMMNNTSMLSNFIYLEEDNHFSVFGCITRSKDNLEKLQKHYNDLKLNTNIREFNLSFNMLKDTVDNVDLLLNRSTDDKEITELCSTSLNSYKEVK